MGTFYLSVMVGFKAQFCPFKHADKCHIKKYIRGIKKIIHIKSRGKSSFIDYPLKKKEISKEFSAYFTKKHLPFAIGVSRPPR